MLSKSDGTNTWLYQWNEDSRLLQVTLPGGAIVSYTYDFAGRMLTRTSASASGTTVFECYRFSCYAARHRS